VASTARSAPRSALRGWLCSGRAGARRGTRDRSRAGANNRGALYGPEAVGLASASNCVVPNAVPSGGREARRCTEPIPGVTGGGGAVDKPRGWARFR